MKISVLNSMKKEQLEAVVAGFKKHGDNVVVDTMFNPSADFMLSWGLNRSPIQTCIKNKKNFLLLERGYVGDRFRFTSFGINGLNGLADFNTDNVPSDRWDKYFGHIMKPWRPAGGYALIAGQIPFDSALYGLDFWAWVEEMGNLAKKYYDRVYFRNHPAYKREIKTTLPLEEKGMLPPKLVITYSSNYAVDSVIRGVPTMSCFPGSMAWDVTSHSFDEPLFKGDRTEWSHKLAYCQWLNEEFESGEAWEHLRPKALELCT